MKIVDNILPFAPELIYEAGIGTVEKIITRIKRHPSAAPFLEPVDPVELGLDDYYDIIKEPMDLGTVEKKLRNNDYNSPYQFFTDVRKIWSNAFTYNPRNSQPRKYERASCKPPVFGGATPSRFFHNICQPCTVVPYTWKVHPR